MANSQVSSNSINSNYPVAGVNNDSKGFRDNFAAIKNAFNTTAYELSELRSKAVLKTALSSAVLENDLNNNTIYRARLSAYSETFYNIGNSNEGITINYELGNFQKVTSTNDFDLNFINFPNGTAVGRVCLWVVVTDSAHSIKLPPSVTYGLGARFIDGDRIVFPDLGNYLIEILSVNSGSNYWVVGISGLNEFGNAVSSSNTTVGGLPIASPSQFGVVKVDGITIEINNGIISVVGGTVAPSDVRLKSNVATITNALEINRNLRGVCYTMNSTQQPGIGVIAQETAQVLPEVVKQGQDGYLGVNYGNMSGLFIECIKQLESKIQILEQELQQLRSLDK